MVDEKTPLLKDDTANHNGPEHHRTKHSWPRRIPSTIVGSFRIFISAVAAPGVYLIACFYDDNGRFSLTMPFIRIRRQLSRKQRRKEKQAVDMPARQINPERDPARPSRPATVPAEMQHQEVMGASPSTQHHRSPSTSSTSSIDSDANEESRLKRSIRIKAVNEDALRKRRQRRGGNESKSRKPSHGSQKTPLTAENIKSPTSPSSASRLTRYPRAPAPPRPLVPKRQPSYALAGPAVSNAGRKTLIIDLDETLIHSMAKGGRMSTGHMVEVKLQNPVGVGGAVLGPQVPILYYVHKRPHCDEFLKKVRTPQKTEIVES